MDDWDKCTRCGVETGYAYKREYYQGKVYCDSCVGRLTREVIDQYKQIVKIPEDALVINYLEGFSHIDVILERYNDIEIAEINLMIWKDNGILNFALSPEPVLNKDGKVVHLHADFINANNNKTLLPIASIDKQDIIFFSHLGDMYTKTSGGGYSLKGALIGGLIAGGAGAILGSREKIKTDLVDKRATALTINKNGEIKSILFGSNAISIFLKLIPDKDFKLISVVKQQEPKPNKCLSKNEDDIIIAKIEKLASLKAKGIISEEEFDDRKKQLLDKFTN